MSITTDDILDALRDALGQPNADGAHTVQEICEIMGCGATATRKALIAMQKAGRLEVIRVRRVALDGRTCSTPAYRVKP